MDELQQLLRTSLSRPGYWRSFIATTHTSHAPAEARLSEVHAPALVIMGDEDPDFPDAVGEANWIAEQLSGRVLTVPGSGHYPQAEYPEVVAPAIVDFLREVGTDA